MNHTSVTTEEPPRFCPACGKRTAKALVITVLGFYGDTQTTAHECTDPHCRYTFSEVGRAERQTDDEPE